MHVSAPFPSRLTASRRSSPRAIVLVLALVLGLTAQPGRAQEGWTIESFHAAIQIQADASLRITEQIDVDFGARQMHGIFREIPVRYRYDDKYNRVYRLDVESITDGQGTRWPYERSRNGANIQLKIGDPDKEISGAHRYEITYRVQGALNLFPDHTELFWNVTGADWPVPIRGATATVSQPGGVGRVACFQGARGSTEPCAATTTADRAEFAATRGLSPGEQLTIVTDIQKGAIAEPALLLERTPRTVREYFIINPATLGATAVLLAAGLGLLGRAWWTRGRDRRYTTIYYLTRKPTEETRPLFKGDQVVLEFQPPEGLRPAEVGLLLDERVDTLDATATIIDLAVRGHLGITEVPRTGLFKRFRTRDWTLTKKNAETTDMKPYERVIFTGLFKDRDTVQLSALKNSFHTTLKKAQTSLYQDAAQQGWFSGNPEKVRIWWLVIGVGVMVAGGALTYGLGRFFGAAIAGIPVMLTGLLLLATAGIMPRRTAAGSELLRRTLGFRQYVATAEREPQRFNERANIFAEYLPYAIVFGLVDRWARAFREIDTAAATAGWYSGTGYAAFSASDFSRSVSGFSSSVSSTIASTPGGRGSSGFSGGAGAGGGGGGGGGGGW